MRITVSSMKKRLYRLLHENHIPGDENFSVIFNLTGKPAAVRFAPDFAVTHRYQL